MRKILFTFLALVTAVTAYSQDDALVGFILANEDACVQSYNEDKIYLNADRIIATDQGVILNVNGAFTPIDALYSDGQGCYVKPCQPYEILNRCPGCGNKYFVWYRTPGCPYNPNTPK